MQSVIWKYELMPSYPSVDDLDAAIGADRCMQRTLSLPHTSMPIGLAMADPLALSDSRAAHDVTAIVGYFTVDPDPKTKHELFRIWLCYTGAAYPMRKHLGSVVVCQHRPRVVHVFMGPA